MVVCLAKEFWQKDTEFFAAPVQAGRRFELQPARWAGLNPPAARREERFDFRSIEDRRENDENEEVIDKAKLE